MSMNIRKAQSEDAYEFAACHTACWRDAYTGLVPDEVFQKMEEEQEERTEICRGYLQEPGDNEYYYAELDGKMIGRLVFGKCRDEDKPDAAEIHAIYLLAEYWDKGYGRQMLDFALGVLVPGGYSEFIIWVLEDNCRAINFYKKYGFVADGERKILEIGKPLVTVRYVRSGLM